MEKEPAYNMRAIALDSAGGLVNQVPAPLALLQSLIPFLPIGAINASVYISIYVTTDGATARTSLT